MPWTMAAFTVAALSMVGLPPMAGFFSKWYLALATLEKSNGLLLAVILISSLLNLVYFFRILEKVYMRPRTDTPPEEEGDIAINEVGASMLWPTLILAAGLIILGLLNAFIVKGVLNFIVPAAGMLRDKNDSRNLYFHHTIVSGFGFTGRGSPDPA